MTHEPDREDRKRRQIETALFGVEAPNLRVEQVMTPRPLSIGLDTSVFDLVRLFHERRFRHVLVVDPDGRLVGVVSDRDVLRCFGLGDSPEPGALRQIRTADVMSSDLITIRPMTSLGEAVRMLREFGINCLPVVEDAAPIGILTSTDLYAVLEALLGVRSTVVGAASPA